MRDHLAFIVWFSVLCVASVLMAFGLVAETIALHPSAGGWL